MKLKNIFLVGLGLVALASCKKTWLDINTSPNTLPTSTPDAVFTAGTNRTAATLGPNELGEYWSGHWTQSTTYILTPSIFAYDFNNTNFNYWDGYYDILEDFQYAIDNANALPYFGATSRVMKAYVYQMLVDLYGNVPYTQSLKGLAVLAPTFDDQKNIYEDLIKQLDTAITVLRANPLTSSYASADIVFGSNVSTARTRWIQFANSLKLRLLIRQSRIAGRDAYIIAEINKAAATTEGFLPLGTDVGSNPGYLATSGKLNPFYENWGYNASGSIQSLARYPRPTEYLFNTLKATNDTFRLKRLAYPKGGPEANPYPAEIVSNYVGVPFGAASGWLAQNTSYIGPSQIKRGEYNRPMILMTNAEVQFLLAEAKQRYGAAVNLASTAQTYYENGVKESFRLTGTTANYDGNPADNPLPNPPRNTATLLLTSGKDLADWNASPDKLKAIWMQKWLALTNYNGLEAWSEFRRTNFPVTPPSLSTSPTAPLPVRIYYPQTELASNGSNVQAQGAINVFSSRLFWDVD
jgi:hypothetical protein